LQRGRQAAQALADALHPSAKKTAGGDKILVKYFRGPMAPANGKHDF
jgi:hypothetical protein